MMASRRYVAFLRAINVGGRVVKMSALKRLFERMGFASVETFIASGNVIFATTAPNSGTLEARIERALEAELGYEVKTFVRSTRDVAAIARHDPFGGEQGATLYVALLSAPPPVAARRAVERLSCASDALRVHGRELYWLCRTSFKDSAVTAAGLEKTLAMPATVRNINTLRRLAAKYAESAST